MFSWSDVLYLSFSRLFQTWIFGPAYLKEPRYILHVVPFCYLFLVFVWRCSSSNENFAVKWSFPSHTLSPFSWQSLFASLVRRFRGSSEGYRSSYSAVNFWAIYVFPFRTWLSSSFCIISALPRLPWPFLLTESNLGICKAGATV